MIIYINEFMDVVLDIWNTTLDATATTGDLSSVLCSNCTDEMFHSDENNFYWFISEMFERENLFLWFSRKAFFIYAEAFLCLKDWKKFCDWKKLRTCDEKWMLCEMAY